MSADLSPPAPKRSDHNRWNYLLLIPIVLPLLTFLYNHETPKLFGIPFFYWFQLALVFVSAAVTGIVYFATEKSRNG